jgi:membrane protein
MYLGPDVDHPQFRFVTPGAVIAVVGWLLVSAGFAVYTASFASYEKTWGSLTAVIVTLTWLWLGSFALLFGGEVNAEVERSRELRQGLPAEEDLRIPRTTV